MTLRIRTLLLPALLLLASAQTAVVTAQPATPDTDDALQGHLEWVLGLFEGGAADLTEAEVEERFDQSFLDVVPADELIATVRPLAAQLGSLKQIDDQSRNPGEFIGVFEAESGNHVMIAIAIDSESGLVTGFFITPADASTAAGTPAAAPGATP
ncbi:MAG TPA: hypothetical protein VD789_14175, partial [Thermomicrobiales bacterium]|nr:hypothetical protein [Thermomicrobiales bacterium]